MAPRPGRCRTGVFLTPQVADAIGAGADVTPAPAPLLELRFSRSGVATVSGYATTWADWTEIRSPRERGGPFLERFDPRSMSDTIRQDGAQLRSMYDHGQGVIGTLPLGPIVMRADSVGAFFTLEMLDVDYARQLLPAAEAGLLGSSLRFAVLREQVRARPEPSDYNPHGIPEVTYTAVRVREISLTPIPANPKATATVGAAQPAKSEGSPAWQLA
jgi:hypothetical protein